MQSYKYVVYDLTDGANFLFVDTKEEAKKLAEDWLEEVRDYANEDGWPEDMEGAIGFAEVIEACCECNREDKPEDPEEAEDWPSSFDFICDYKLEPVEPKQLEFAFMKS